MLLPKDEDSPSSAIAFSKEGRSDSISETILLGGPYPEVRAHLRALLVRHDYAVLEAVNDEHAEMLCADFGPKINLVVLHSETVPTDSRFVGWLGLLPDIPVITLPVYLATSTRNHARASTTVDALFRIPCTSEGLLHKIDVVLEASRSRKTVLIVDDDDSMRRILAELLEAAGYEASHAANGKEALQSLARRKAQVVLTELVMPGADGLELIQQLRQFNPEVRLVAMSGASRTETCFSVARLLGARAVLEKPFQVERLLQTVREVLSAP